MDIFERVKKQKGNIGQYAKQAHGYFAFPKLEGEIGPRMKFRGREVLNWSLNNYIGLANDPEVKKADAEYAAQWGLAYPMGARMMSGQTSRHEYLESQLADFVGKPDAFLLNFGYQGMISIIDAMTSRFDCIVYDAESHACIMDGLRLSPAKRFVYVHNDIPSLRKQLERATKWVETTGGGILVITEGVFGMAGDLGKLDEITALKEEFDFRLLVDDAHGFGTMGPTGAGTGEHFGVQAKIDLYFGTFAKAMAGFRSIRRYRRGYLYVSPLQYAFSNFCKIPDHAYGRRRYQTLGIAEDTTGTPRKIVANCSCLTNRTERRRSEYWKDKFYGHPCLSFR